MVNDEAMVGLMKIHSLFREERGKDGQEGMSASPRLTKHVQQKQDELVGGLWPPHLP